MSRRGYRGSNGHSGLCASSRGARQPGARRWSLGSLALAGSVGVGSRRCHPKRWTLGVIDVTVEKRSLSRSLVALASVLHLTRLSSRVIPWFRT